MAGENDVLVINDDDGNTYLVERSVLERGKVSPENMAAVKEAMSAPTELDDSQLDEVAGGLSFGRSFSRFSFGGAFRFNMPRGATLAARLRNL